MVLFGIWKAFPLFLNGGSSKYTHSYTFCSDIGSLLRAKVLVGDQWYHITNPLRYLDCYYDNNRTATRIATPKLYGYYAVCSDEQLEYYRSKPYVR